MATHTWYGPGNWDGKGWRQQNGPFCSRCCKPLEYGKHLRTRYTGDGFYSIESVYSCPDGCASVAARWKLTLERLRWRNGLDLGWGQTNRPCSRCQTPLLARGGVMYARPVEYWCPGCGPVE